MRRETFRYIEAELRDYPETRKRFMERVADICVPSGKPPGVDAPIPADHKEAAHWRDATGSQAVRLNELRHTQAVLKAIERTVLLNRELVEMCEMRYWGERRMPWKEVAEHFGRDESTLRRVRNRMVYRIAKDVGFLW